MSKNNKPVILLKLITFSFLVFNINANVLFAENNNSLDDNTNDTTINILEIEENEFIKGNITSLPDGKPEDYKIIVYVKTDKWYLHPYERGGPGKSYATLESKDESCPCSWIIQTVKRDFLADYVAAFLVKKAYKPPKTVNSIANIDFIAHHKIEGNDKL